MLSTQKAGQIRRASGQAVYKGTFEGAQVDLRDGSLLVRASARRVLRTLVDSIAVIRVLVFNLFTHLIAPPKYATVHPF